MRTPKGERPTREPLNKVALISGIAGAVVFGLGSAYLESQTHWVAQSAHNEYLFALFPTKPLFKK